ncbi:MAG: zinc metalloprotease [Bacteroidota bacterium]
MKKLNFLNNYWLLLLIFIMISCLPPEKQRIQFECGTMDEYEERLKSDVQFAQNEANLEKSIAEYIKNMQVGEQIEFRSGKVVIPVVIHVVYQNTTENISDAQIQSQINVLNEDFRKLNSDVSSVPTEFQSIVTDARIEFKLAQRDPDCNPTNGITRTSTTVTGFTKNMSASTPTTRNPVKFTSSGGRDGWPSDEYLNIWVCNLAGTLLGYGSFPADFASRPTEDGVVMDFEAFGTTGTSITPFNLGRVLVHEIGHWLNLRHIWGDDGSACTGSDEVGDTPNQGGNNSGCPTHPSSSCGSNDMFMNYMDYVDNNCMFMFTNGQSDRMDAVLYTTRADLVSSQGDIAPPSVPEDLYSRDMMDDIGDEPNTTSAYMYKSDDIWVRHSNDGITNQEHQNPIGGSKNYVYVRVRNRGCGASSNAQVKLYWAKASSGLSWPVPWDGSVTSPALMGGFIDQKATGSVIASGFVVLVYEWNTPNPADYSSFGADKIHFCLLSRIETSTTSPFGMTFTETTSLSQNVRNNNNIVWKNISVAEPSSSGNFSSALIANYAKTSEKYKVLFEISKGELSLFDYGKVTIDLDDKLYRIWKEGGMEGEALEMIEQNKIMLLKSGASLNNIVLNSGQMGVITINFEPNIKLLKYKRYIFNLEMLQYKIDGNKFIGGQTFKFRLSN